MNITRRSFIKKSSYSAATITFLSQGIALANAISSDLPVERVVERTWDVPEKVHKTQAYKFTAQQKLLLPTILINAVNPTGPPVGVNVNLPMKTEMIPIERFEPVTTYTTDPSPLVFYYRQKTDGSGDWEAYIPAYKLIQTTDWQTFTPVE